MGEAFNSLQAELIRAMGPWKGIDWFNHRPEACVR
jgi:hypothetical protein